MDKNALGFFVLSLLMPKKMLIVSENKEKEW